MELTTDLVRAKAGWIETTRLDKAGRTVPARDHVVVSEGLYTAREMERAMRDVAREVGAPESAIRISTYQRGESPIEANPRHRDGAPKRVYGGFGPGANTRGHA